MLQTRVFSIDEEKKTTCALVLTRDSETELDYLHISTFTVYSLLSEQDGDGFIDHEDFIKIVVKDSHVYQVGTELRADLPPSFEFFFPLVGSRPKVLLFYHNFFLMDFVKCTS